jgi:hypothetical protein
MTDGRHLPGGDDAPDQQQGRTAPNRPDPRVPHQPTPGNSPVQDGHPDDTMTFGILQQPRAAAPPPQQQQNAGPTGYGYPQQAGPPAAYGYPQPQQPQQQGPVQPPLYTPPQPFVPAPNEPDWAALAERNEAGARRKRLLKFGGIVLAACLLGGAVGELALHGLRGKPKAAASASATPSTSASPAPVVTASSGATVPGQPSLLADHSGTANLAMGPDAVLNQATDGFALRLKSDGNSYAESADPIVDVSKSFSLSAWVFNEADGGTRTAVSQGDGISFSFDLGRGVEGTKAYWFFKVQTGTGGADSTTYEVTSKNLNTLKAWTLLTATYDASTQRIALYADGSLVGATTVPKKIWSGPGPFEIGRARHHAMWTEFWAGVMSHVQVWNVALTADDAAKLKADKVGLTARPVSSWLVG